MEHHDAPKGQPRSPRPDTMQAPTEKELSRMAREGVRQPPDPRLDKELARMGLLDASEPAESQPGHSRGRSEGIGTEVERLRKDLRRVETIVWVLVAVSAILALMVLILFIR